MPPQPLAWMLPTAAVVAVLLVPASSADPEGTETSPELNDAAGDVRYGVTHTGGPSPHIDLRSVWLEHDAANDTINLTMTTESGNGLETASQDRAITCSGEGNSTRDGRLSGNFRFSWSKRLGASNIDGYWTWREQTTNPTGSGPSEGRPIEHQFHKRLGSPAYFVWTAERSALLAFAETIRSLEVTCFEFPRAAGVVPLDENSDGGTSAAEYSFLELRRVRTPDGTEVPWIDATHSTTGSEGDETDSAPTPALAPAFTVVGFVGIAVWLRRRG